MEPKRLGGALLTAVVTGVGIMVPYTFKTIAPALMAAIWAVLVFAGICGLVLALKPEGSSHPPKGADHTRVKPHRPTRDDSMFGEMFEFYGSLAIMLLAPFGILLAIGLIIRLAIYLATGA